MDAPEDTIADHKLSATDYAIITCNRDETIASWDHRAEKTFGWTAREAVGQKLFYLLLPPAPDSIPSLTLTDVISTGGDNSSQQFNLSQLAQHKDGSTFSAHFLIFTVKDSTAIIVLVRDLGKQQRLLAKINDSFEQQSILDDILKISVEPLPLGSQLEKILDRLFEVPQLQLLPKAAVFLAEAGSDAFTLKARRGFKESVTLRCAEYPQGICRYGQSAQYEVFKLPSCTKNKSLDTCGYASSHGHYCTPIRRGEKTIGIICFYTRKNHTFSTATEQMVRSICNIIATMVESREMDLQLIGLIHDLRLSINEIKEQKKFSESIIQGLTTGLIVTDLEGNIHTCNALAESIMSAFTERLGDKNLLEVVGQDAAGRMLDINHHSMDLEQELTIASANGDEKIIGYSVVAREDARGIQVGRIISINDISELKYVRKEMEKMNRLATVAEIASAVAHEVRNPLAGIKIMAQSIQGQSVTQEEQTECLTRIIRQVDRLNSLLTEFFSYARPAEPQICASSLTDIITETQHLIANKMLKNHIVFEEDYQQNLPLIVADPNQVQQVLLNLFLNAMDAIQQGGIIKLKTFHIKGLELSRHRRKHPGLLPQSSYVAMSVADNGIGMAPEVAEKVFEPFFTTKSTGTGLGLSIVYRTLRENNAAITVESTPNKGTTFTIYFSTEH